MYGMVKHSYLHVDDLFGRTVGKYFIHGAFGIDHDHRGTGKFVNSRFVLNSAHELAICGIICVCQQPLKLV